jgi:SAM-dependent methyltransferase
VPDLDTLERIVPLEVPEEDLAGAASLALHYERYRYAAEHAKPGQLLDLACGVGYGTHLISEERPDIDSLLGVDLSQGAVDYATEEYEGGRVRYEQGDAMTFREGSADRFDTIVSLETIEHVPEPITFFRRLAGLLAPGGILIGSVPTTPSVDLNPHHLHDFTERSFRQMGTDAGLSEISSHKQIQRVGLSELWSGDRRFRREQLRENLLGYYVTHPRALVGRVVTTLRYGLANHYTTIVWKNGA